MVSLPVKPCSSRVGLRICEPIQPIRRGDRSGCFQSEVNRSGHESSSGIRSIHTREGGQFGSFIGGNGVADIPAVPDTCRTSGPQRRRAKCQTDLSNVSLGSDQVRHVQASRMISSFSEDGVSHSSSPPSPIMLFLSRRSSKRYCSATTSLRSRASRLGRSFTLPPD